MWTDPSFSLSVDRLLILLALGIFRLAIGVGIGVNVGVRHRRRLVVVGGRGLAHQRLRALRVGHDLGQHEKRPLGMMRSSLEPDQN